jgi:hypothetical protein
MVILKKEIEDRQSNFRQIRADTDSLSSDIEDLISEVLDKKFMKEYTRYSDINEFIDDSPVDIQSLDNVQATQFNRFVSKNTLFDNWEEMKQKAVDEWFASRAKF